MLMTSFYNMVTHLFFLKGTATMKGANSAARAVRNTDDTILENTLNACANVELHLILAYFCLLLHYR